jgi:hypothetical protein
LKARQKEQDEEKKVYYDKMDEQNQQENDEDVPKMEDKVWEELKADPFKT